MPYANPDDKKKWRKSYDYSKQKEQTARYYATPKGKACKERKRQKSQIKSMLNALARRLQPAKPRFNIRKYAADVRLIAIKALGGKCKRCGIDDERVLEFDHVEPLLRRTNKVANKDNVAKFARIRRGELSVLDGIQLLCSNCHNIKTREGNEWAMRFEGNEAPATVEAGDVASSQLSLL